MSDIIVEYDPFADNSCTDCKHSNKDGTCIAFPIRIPDEILSGENKHLKPLANQGNDLCYCVCY